MTSVSLQQNYVILLLPVIALIVSRTTGKIRAKYNHVELSKTEKWAAFNIVTLGTFLAAVFSGILVYLEMWLPILYRIPSDLDWIMPLDDIYNWPMILFIASPTIIYIMVRMWGKKVEVEQ